MKNLKGKKLLVLGGTSASLGVVREAHKLGIYVVVADQEETGVAKKIADEAVVISTVDTGKLVEYIKANNIEAVFCGPTEFNLMNTMKVCNAAGLPFYATKAQWDMCSNKARFKELCRENGVPCVPEYHVTKDLLKEDLDSVQYPVIVKPVDGCSSKGITVCRTEDELKKAVPLALSYSESKQIIVEKYLVGAYGLVCRYIVNNGKVHLVAVNDNYTVDESDGKIMITAVAVFPSKRIDAFICKIHPHVEKMAEAIGMKNGTFFMQARVDGDDNEIYFHEMGLRLSGGVLYPIYQEVCGFSDMQMMIHNAFGLGMGDESDMDKIDPYFNGTYVGSICVPLKAGIVQSIKGLEEIRNDPDVFDVLQYYYPGDVMTEEKIGTLMQHLCRIKFKASDYAEVIKKINQYQKLLDVRDTDGNDMVYRYFDTNRMEWGN